MKHSVVQRVRIGRIPLGLSALCALRTAGDATSLRLIEQAGTFDDEATIETYRAKGPPRVERGWDDMRRAIARAVAPARSARRKNAR